MSRHEMTGNEMSYYAEGGIERHTYDVVIVGAGGAGLRAAIAAHEAGATGADDQHVVVVSVRELGHQRILQSVQTPEATMRT